MLVDSQKGEDEVVLQSPLLDEARSATAGPPRTQGIAKRWIFTALITFGFWNVYAMRVNLSEAVDPMQKQYGWSDSTKGYVLSSFFWGYLCGQIAGAFLAETYGGKIVLGVGIFITSLLTLVIPFVAHSIGALFLVRALMGIGESVTYPASNVMCTKWAPAAERTFIVTMGSAGAYLGTTFAFPIAGVLIDLHENDNGISTTWPLVFYVFGGIGLLWCVLWNWLAASSPTTHSTISPDEREYVVATARQDADEKLTKVEVTKSDSVPIVQFLIHPLAWALYFNHFTANYGAYTLLTFLPTFLKEQLKFDMKHAGLIAVIPYLAMTVGAIGASLCSDHFVRTKVCSVRTMRNITGPGAFVVCAVFLVAAGFANSVNLAMVCLTISVGASGVAASSFNPSYLDLSPHYGGVFYSIGNTLGNISGIVAPIVAGQVLEAGRSRGAWQLIFLISAGLYLFAAIIFVVSPFGKPTQKLN